MNCPESYTLHASAARTAAITGADQVNRGFRGMHLVISATDETGTAVITPTIQGKDACGIYYDILVGAAIDATGVTVLKVYPGIGAVANGAASDVLPAVWRLNIAVADADPLTYSVGVNYLP